jgi:hypothetical protein
MALTRALPGLIAAGVVLAAVVLWQLSGNRWVRWIIAAATAYAAAALVAAMATGLTLRAALAGPGLNHPLPRVLQGAFVGAFIVLPLGWLVSVVRAGIPRFREASPQRTWYQAVALTTCVGLVAASLPPANSDRASAQSTAARLVELDNSIHAIEDGERESPRDRWDPEYVVRVIGRDPEKLFAWVRERTSWIPYRGVLRGPIGVLMDRQGNSLDRALLMAALLERAGHTVRLAHGELTPEQATDLLPTLVTLATPGSRTVPSRYPAPPAAVASANNTSGSNLRAVAARYQLDGSAIERMLTAQDRALARVQSDLDARVADQTTRLLATVPRPDSAEDWNRRLDASRGALRDHWWVQRQDGQHWVDFDLLDLAGKTGASLAAPKETLAMDDIPSELHHDIAIRVIAEKWSSGTLQESKVLDHVLRPAEVIGRPVVLQFWPGAWPSEMQHDPNGRFGLKATALEQQQWVVVLAIGQDPAAHAIISDTADESAPSNPFAGFAQALSQPEPSGRSRRDALTAVWLEYEVRSPGRAPRTIRRAVFDLLGPAMRAAGSAPQLPFGETQRLTRSFALMMRTEILPVACRIAPEFVAHLLAQSMATNKKLLHTILANDFSPRSDEIQQAIAHAAEPSSPLLGLALSRLGLSAFADDVLVDRLNILTRHQYLVADGNDVAVKAAFDVVANDVGIDLAVMDGFVVRVRQGILDTNAEAILAADPAAANTAEAFAMSRDWLTVNAAGRSAVDALAFSSDIRRRIVQDLDRGYMVVAPKAPLHKDRIVGWWRIDPLTGETLGIGSNGWGMGPEDSALLNMAVSAASGFTFEYGLCQALPQGLNLLTMLNERYFGSWHPSWASARKSEDPGKLLEENNRMCLVQAIAAGFIATLPILLMTMKVRNMRRAARLAEEMAAKEAEAKALDASLKNWEKELLELPEVEGPPPKTLVDARNGADLKNTIVPEPRPGWKTDPAALLQRERILQAADDNMNRLQQQLNKSMGEYLEYQRGRLYDPKYNPEVEAALRNRAELDYQSYSQAVDELLKLDPSRGGGWGARGGGGGAPPPVPVGNNNLTVDQQPVIVGAAGASNALKGGS